jgi:MerR, DNA binding
VVDIAQRAGLNLDEIRLLLDASPADQLATERLREVAQRKIPELGEATARAELVRGWLEDAARCRCPTLDDCPLFEEALLPDVADRRRRPSGGGRGREGAGLVPRAREYQNASNLATAHVRY